MASKIPSSLSLTKPAWQTVTYQGVPMFRAQAWALLDYELAGGHLQVNSADRRDAILKKFAPHLHGQQYLYDHQNFPGFFPANPPSRTSHCLFSDGTAAYRRPAGARLPSYMLGIDAVDRPGGDAAKVVSWLNAHGYHAVRPYRTGSERHHFIFTKSPATNARKRLARYIINAEPTLKQGQTGVSIVKLKKLLYDQGMRNFSGVTSSNRFNPYFSKWTAQAVRRFQKKHDLPTDGVVGPKTWKALKK